MAAAPTYSHSSCGHVVAAGMCRAALALPAYLRSAVETEQCLDLQTHPIVCRNMQTCISPGSAPPSFSLGSGSVTLRAVCHIAPYVPFTLPAQISAR